MNLIVNSHPESIAAALDLERRTEQAKIVESLGEILACKVTESHTCGPWIWRSDHLDEVLRRQRETIVPRLQGMVEGRDGESEPVRVYAAVIVGRVDPHLGFRALLSLLDSDDPVTLYWTLDESHTLIITAEEDRLDPADFVPEPGELVRMLAFLDHPDDRVVRMAIFLLHHLEPAGFFDHFLLPRIDDPVHGKSIQGMLARDGRDTRLLERAYASLSTPDRAIEDDHALELIESFARSDDPRNAPRALEMMKALLVGESLLPKEREHIEIRLRWAADRRDALRPDHRLKAIAQVDRLVAAGIIDRVAGDRAIARLGSDPEGNWNRVDYWGAIEAFRASGTAHFVNFKGSDYPPAHDDLVHDLARISQGVFRPEGIYQLRESWFDHGHDYPVQFVHQGRLYRFDVDYLRASYLLDAVLEAANEAVSDASDSRRFAYFFVSCPRDVMIVCGGPEALDTIAREFGLKPQVPFATTVGSVKRLGDASRHRIWDQIAISIGDLDRKLSIEEVVRWRDPTNGETALHHEVRTAHFTMRLGYSDRVNVLLRAGADIHARSFEGKTPLHEIMAAESNERRRLLEMLLHSGADVHATDHCGMTVLHRAAEGGDREIMTMLLDRGADLHLRDSTWGFTPLHWAARHWQAEGVRLLLDRGAEVDARVRRYGRHSDPPKDRLDPIDFSKAMVAREGLDSLLCDGQTTLHIAVIMGHAAFELLIERGADVNATDDLAHTPLDLALILDRRRTFVSLLRTRGGTSRL